MIFASMGGAVFVAFDGRAKLFFNKISEG